MNTPDKAYFLARVSRDMDEDLGALNLSPREAPAGGFREAKPELAQEARAFLLQPSIVRGTFAYWARKCGIQP